MWAYKTTVRSARGGFNIYNRQLLEALEVENMALVAQTICLSAAARNESRGNHYRSDHPELDNDHWLKNIYIKTAGGVQVEEKPVVVTEIPLEDLTKGE
jgi:succinate dehydrogenase/fumarate reductase flavoprotein subunit